MSASETVGKDGQVILDKDLAGKQVVVDQVEPDLWVIKVGDQPDESWLDAPGQMEKLDKAIAWAEQNPAVETDLDELASKIRS